MENTELSKWHLWLFEIAGSFCCLECMHTTGIMQKSNAVCILPVRSACIIRCRRISDNTRLLFVDTKLYLARRVENLFLRGAIFSSLHFLLPITALFFKRKEWDNSHPQTRMFRLRSTLSAPSQSHCGESGVTLAWLLNNHIFFIRIADIDIHILNSVNRGTSCSLPSKPEECIWVNYSNRNQRAGKKALCAATLQHLLIGRQQSKTPLHIPPFIYSLQISQPCQGGKFNRPCLFT